ncbi:hypothetical protein SLS53_008620 [Cytospora paraplurivora]|uniref:Uncharacterized protein n=1 Tax=Cytospora paraplurivora TaxID=2898453 RepID=A0AAN9TX80_9PEZI
MVYRLSVTRRCLNCDHQLCFGEQSPTDLNSKKRKRNRGGPCKAEFDYRGWSLYNSWRRTVLLNPTPITSSSASIPKFPSHNPSGNLKPSTQNWGDEYAAIKVDNKLQKTFADRRDSLFVRRKHNCWLHCDFPSECHHAVYRALQEGRPILAEAEALDAAKAAAAALVTKRNGGRFKKRSKEVVEEEGHMLATVKEEYRGEEEEEEEEEEVDLLRCNESGGEEDEDVSPCSPEPPRDLLSEPEVSPVTPTKGSGSEVIDFEEAWERAGVNSASDQITPREFEIYVDETQVTTTQSTKKRYSYYKTNKDDEIDELSVEFYQNGQADSERPSRRTVPPSAQIPYPIHLSGHFPTVDELESAYSEEAWYTTTQKKDDKINGLPYKHPERHFTRDEMLVLLARRTDITNSDDSSTTECMTADVVTSNWRQKKKRLLGTGEDWDSWSDNLSSSSSSSSSAPSLSGSGEGESVAVVDLSGDSPMPEALVSIDEEDNMLSPQSPVSPVKEDGKDDEPNLMSLLRMRNEFMRGAI